LTLPLTSAPIADTTTSITSPSASITYPQVHPFANISENSYLPPHEHNFASTSKGKEREGPAYHMAAPVQNN
jgi:hypothetical protein